MELRPVHTALAAGRAASRWATSASTRASSSSSSPSTSPSSGSSLASPSSTFRRHLSATRPALQEAEAAAPGPWGMASLAADVSRFKQQQQRRQHGDQQPYAQQPQRPGRLGPAPQSALQSFRSMLGSPDDSSTTTTTSSSSPSSSFPAPPPPQPAGGTAWANAGERYLQPWSRGRAKNGVVSAASTIKMLGDLGLGEDPVMRPDPRDLESRAAMQLINERPVDIKYRLQPAIGRTVELRGKVDVARAFAMLNMKCAVNKVKYDFNKQKFFERKGLKKKRLRRERWRVRFKDGFKASCARVKELARQGW